MYEYNLSIGLYDKYIKDEYVIQINYKAFDQIDAEKIAKMLTENIPNLSSYALFRKEDIFIKNYKKQ